ncbi:MAG: alanine racemase [Bacteriovoracaceae bacterium]|nr:alanine racemase [Bacteriovoracaceae bacterium]
MRAQTTLHINLNFFLENFYLASKKSGDRPMTAMVKADAYGHGMGEVAQCLENVRPPSLDSYGVATLEEGIRLRNEIKSSPTDIYIFSENHLLPHYPLNHYPDCGLIPVLSSLDQIKIFFHDSNFKHVPLCIKVDTGMNRLGIKKNEREDLVKILKSYGRKSIYHFMSHFACSDTPEHPLNGEQRSEYEEWLRFLRSEGIMMEKTSLANSGSISHELENFCTHVRPGLRLYTGYGEETEGKTISSLESEIIQIKELPANTPFGYGAATMGRAGWLYILPLGYADGLLLSARGFKFLVEETEVEIVGRVNMDLVYLWSEKPLKKKVGSKIILWSNQNNQLNSLAKHQGVHVYQVLTGISHRVPRIYHVK